MAEERNLALSRAGDSVDAETDQTKAALQRRMEEARESITQTVTEIKDTVVNQYQQVKENISDTLDWREQYRRHTLPFTLTAFAVGVAAGYAVMGAFKGDDEEYDEDRAFDRIEQGFDRGLQGSSRSYAAQPVLGRASAGAYQRSSLPDTNSQTEGGYGQDVGPETRPSYSSGYQAPTAPQPQPLAAQEAEEEEPKGPGLLERFKETKAYDRLQEELSTLGERALEELSKTARTVVVPALLNKLQSMIGLDLSGQQPQGAAPRRQAAGTQAAQPAYSGGGSTGSIGSTGTTDAPGTSARAAAGGTEGYGAS